jgi:hypothetical protein
MAPPATNCPSAEVDFPETVGFDFSAIGYTNACDTAAVFVYSRNCYGESYSIHEVRKTDQWAVTHRHTLYERGQ